MSAAVSSPSFSGAASSQTFSAVVALSSLTISSTLIKSSDLSEKSFSLVYSSLISSEIPSLVSLSEIMSTFSFETLLTSTSSVVTLMEFPSFFFLYVFGENYQMD